MWSAARCRSDTTRDEHWSQRPDAEPAKELIVVEPCKEKGNYTVGGGGLCRCRTRLRRMVANLASFTTVPPRKGAVEARANCGDRHQSVRDRPRRPMKSAIRDTRRGS
jgi:hypothetical protein